MTSLRWVFTLNNYTDPEVAHISTLCDDNAFRYVVYGREVGENGTPHLQGFIILGGPQRLSFLRRVVSARAHFEVARGTSQQARNYCIKDGDFDEFGDYPGQQGRRTDLETLVAWADAFAAEHGRPAGDNDIARHQPGAFLRFPRFASLCAARFTTGAMETGQPHDGWQRDLEEKLTSEPEDDRKIIFVVDNDGGKGKSWFCRYMLTAHTDSVQILGIGRKADLAHIIDTKNHIFLFNIPRGQMEYLSYPLLEAIKDRFVVSTKYSGCLKLWTKRTHVVVFSNEYPDMDKLSQDRYEVIEL